MTAAEQAAGAPAPERPMSRHAWIVRLQFFALGFCMGSWGVHVPSVKDHFGLGDGALSVALLAAAIGAVSCLGVATSLVERAGLRAVMTVASVVMCGALAGVLWLPAAVPFVIVLALSFAYGAGSALFDVSMNTQGAAVETQGGRKVMSGFHGMWSAGGMSGAFCVSWLHGLGMAPAVQMLGINLLFMAVMVASGVMTRSLATHPATEAPDPGAALRRRSVLPGGLLLTMGLLSLLALVAEGAMYDWSTLFLQREVGVAPALAAAAFGVFSASMALGRFGGDWVRTHVAPVPLMQASGALGAFGMGLALGVGRFEAALVGFALVGLALSNVVPVVFAAASQVDPKRPTHGIATVSAIGYFGFVAGPVLIGFVAEHSSLRWALATVVLFCAVFGLAARRGLKGH